MIDEITIAVSEPGPPGKPGPRGLSGMPIARLRPLKAKRDGSLDFRLDGNSYVLESSSQEYHFGTVESSTADHHHSATVVVFSPTSGEARIEFPHLWVNYGPTPPSLSLAAGSPPALIRVWNVGKNNYGFKIETGERR